MVSVVGPQLLVGRRDLLRRHGRVQVQCHGAGEVEHDVGQFLAGRRAARRAVGGLLPFRQGGEDDRGVLVVALVGRDADDLEFGQYPVERDGVPDLHAAVGQQAGDHDPVLRVPRTAPLVTGTSRKEPGRMPQSTNSSGSSRWLRPLNVVWPRGSARGRPAAPASLPTWHGPPGWSGRWGDRRTGMQSG